MGKYRWVSIDGWCGNEFENGVSVAPLSSSWRALNDLQEALAEYGREKIEPRVWVDLVVDS